MEFIGILNMIAMPGVSRIRRFVTFLLTSSLSCAKMASQRSWLVASLATMPCHNSGHGSISFIQASHFIAE